VWSKGARLAANQRDPRGWIGRAADLYFQGPLDVVGVRTGRRSDFVADTAKPLLLDGLGSYGPGERAVPWWERSRRDAAVKAMLAAGASAQEASPGRELRRSLANAYDLVEIVRKADADYASTVAYPNEALSAPLLDIAKLVKRASAAHPTGSGGYDTLRPARSTGPSAGLRPRSRRCRDLQPWSLGPRDPRISEFGRHSYDNASAGTITRSVRPGAGRRDPQACTDPRSPRRRSPARGDARRGRLPRGLAGTRRHLGVDPAPVFTEAWSGDQRVPLF
jgi:hypothetical protein